MVQHPVGIRSLAVNFPSIIRTNDYYREKYPQIVAQSEQKSLAKLFSLSDSTASNEFDLEMMPYLSDPFRGTVERRILAPGESSLMLEERAARDALDAAKLTPNDVDLMIVASVWPEQIGFGNAAFLAQKLGLEAAAWNLDGACGSTPLAIQNACALVRAGEYHNILVVISCTYSRFVDEDDTVSWFLGDGAGAFVVGSVEPNQGILSTKTLAASVLNDIGSLNINKDKQGNPQIRMQLSKDAKKIFSETAAELLYTCCDGAAAAAGVTMEEIDFFLFNTSTAWFARFATRVLSIDPERTLNLYPLYANIGPVLTVANLYHAAQLGKIRKNDLVLVYGFGAAGVASANLMRWGNVALGSDPHFKESDSPVKSFSDRSIICR
ncbi:3-oxoacyl-ACP synthase [Nostoc sp. CENA67]|uniref:3-oxoacyl-ACP synthase n=1 Tax=Amazonocrinis nigriterrae CENA67 TaxID=2794033 RepID=A0A8J7L6Q6_9NOST|nr:3-oxoacyl-[acyl-carrier-protein] synthase III C-terminal domain-containing protein [Amazonocrinis nigriterrae]MBH8562564.1 3-oxoacyl-ACP synthase [Amazonocrinis nigriterrae CENA67]